jgi:hypothetical protein
MFFLFWIYFFWLWMVLLFLPLFASWTFNILFCGFMHILIWRGFKVHGDFYEIKNPSLTVSKPFLLRNIAKGTSKHTNQSKVYQALPTTALKNHILIWGNNPVYFSIFFSISCVPAFVVIQYLCRIVLNSPLTVHKCLIWGKESFVLKFS